MAVLIVSGATLGTGSWALRSALCQASSRAEELDLSKTEQTDELLSKVLLEGSSSADDGLERAGNTTFPWALLWPYVRPHMLLVVAAALGAVAVALLNMQIPLAMGTLVQVVSALRGGHEAPWGTLRAPAARLCVLYAAHAALTLAYLRALSAAAERVALDLQVSMFGVLLAQDATFFDRRHSAELAHRLTDDVHAFKSAAKRAVSMGLRGAAQALGCAASLMCISPTMACVTACAVPCAAALGSALASRLRGAAAEARAQSERAASCAGEALSGVRTVRAFAAEPRELERYARECSRAHELHERLGTGVAVLQAGTSLFLNALVLGTVCAGGCLLARDQLSHGDLAAYLLAAQTLQRSTAQLAQALGGAARGLAAGAGALHLLQLPPGRTMRPGGLVPQSCAGELELRGVTFAYPTRPHEPVLRDFSLHVPAGATVALVGPSGSGKSTVCALLQRVYEPDAGSVCVDAVDVRELDARWLRGRALALVAQQPDLFAASVRDNVRYGRPDATDEQVERAARLAHAHDFISEMPRAYDTPVGERGAALSGGQRQRVALARALLLEPPVLLLDEATSALDAHAEARVQAALDEARKGRTVLLVAHRLSTVKDADIIVVMHHGEIVEVSSTPTHPNLLSRRHF